MEKYDQDESRPGSELNDTKTKVVGVPISF